MADGIKTKCDFCGEPAVMDGKTTMGPWAFMCNRHFDKYGVKTKGLSTTLEAVTQETKVCSCCNVSKPLNKFYKYTDHNGTTRYRPECIECNLAKRDKIRKGR